MTNIKSINLDIFKYKNSLVSCLILHNNLIKFKKNDKNKFENTLFNKIKNGFGNKIKLLKNKTYNIKLKLNFFNIDKSQKNISYTIYLIKNINKIIKKKYIKTGYSQIYKTRNNNFYDLINLTNKNNKKFYSKIPIIKLKKLPINKFAIIIIKTAQNFKFLKNIKLQYQLYYRNFRFKFIYDNLYYIFIIIFLIWIFSLFICYNLIYFRKYIINNYNLIFKMDNNQKEILKKLVEKKVK